MINNLFDEKLYTALSPKLRSIYVAVPDAFLEMITAADIKQLHTTLRFLEGSNIKLSLKTKILGTTLFNTALADMELSSESASEKTTSFDCYLTLEDYLNLLEVKEKFNTYIYRKVLGYAN